MDINDLANYLANFLASFLQANVIATIVVGVISTTAVLVIGRNSNNRLKEQIELNKENHYWQSQQDQDQHNEQLDQYKQQHQEQLDQDKQQHQVQGLLEAFKLLDNDEHRASRKKVFVLYFKFLKERNVEVFAGVPEVGGVMADFDVIGKLVKSNNISRDDFLNVYGSLAYRCWRCLEGHIMEERKSRYFEVFMSNFEWLAKVGYDYWFEQGYDIDKTRLYNPDEPSESVDFQEIDDYYD